MAQPGSGLGVFRPIRPAHRHLVGGDVGANFFDVRQCLGQTQVRKQDAELLAAVTIGGAAARRLRQAAGHQPEHLIADVVAVGVVEFFEMVHVEHRDRVHRAEPVQPLFQRAAAGQAGQLVAEGEAVRLLQQRHQEDAAGGHDERAESAGRVHPFAGDEERHQCTRVADVQRACFRCLAPRSRPDRGGDESGGKHQPAQQRRRRGSEQPVIEQVLPHRARHAGAAGARDPGDKQDFRHAQHEPAIVEMVGYPALGKHQCQQEVERNQNRGCGEYRARGEARGAEVEREAVGGKRGEQRREPDECAAAIEPRPHAGSQQQHHIGP